MVKGILLTKKNSSQTKFLEKINIKFNFFFVQFFHNVFFVAGKGRLYQTYSVSSSDDGSPAHNIKSSVLYNQPYTSAHHLTLLYKPTAGLSDTPSSSDNASDATLTDTELALARDNTLLVNNGNLINCHLKIFVSNRLTNF